MDARQDAADISVVVPLAAGETAGSDLIRDLAAQCTARVEVVLAMAGTENSLVTRAGDSFSERLRSIVTSPGRAIQLNGGARAASGVYLWFLHADSRLPADALEMLEQAIAVAPRALLYFGLRFHDGPAALRLTALGVEVRSRVFGLPFGDQGFCIRRDLFFKLGGFDESVGRGEDHRFVWKARRYGLPVRRVAATLSTSGRRYAEHGWARTTLRHVGLTVRQAAPELIRPREPAR